MPEKSSYPSLLYSISGLKNKKYQIIILKLAGMLAFVSLLLNRVIERKT